MEQNAVDAAPHPAQLEWRRVPELGGGEDAGAIEPFFHACADAVDLLQFEAKQDVRQVVFGDDDKPVGFLEVGTDCFGAYRRPSHAREACACLGAKRAPHTRADGRLPIEATA